MSQDLEHVMETFPSLLKFTSAGLRLPSSISVNTALVPDYGFILSALPATWYQQMQKLISVTLQLTLTLKEHCRHLSSKFSAFQRKNIDHIQFAMFQTLLGSTYSLYICACVCVHNFNFYNAYIQFQLFGQKKIMYC